MVSVVWRRFVHSSSLKLLVNVWCQINKAFFFISSLIFVAILIYSVRHIVFSTGNFRAIKGRGDIIYPWNESKHNFASFAHCQEFCPSNPWLFGSFIFTSPQTTWNTKQRREILQVCDLMNTVSPSYDLPGLHVQYTLGERFDQLQHNLGPFASTNRSWSQNLQRTPP